MSKQSQMWRILLSAVLFVGMGGFVSRVSADTDLKFSDVVKEMKIGGDLRLRYDDKIYHHVPGAVEGVGKPQTPVFRERFRLAVDFTLPENFFIHTRLDSGVGEQTSPNQTFGNEASQKQIWLDRAYLEWALSSNMKLFGGKMANPLWNQYSSDAWIDGDINPEGLGENFSQLLGNTKLFLNGLQSPIAQLSGNPHNVYLFSEQAGVETKLPLDSRIKLGYAYHDWYNINNTNGVAVDAAPGAGATTPTVKAQEGNRRIGGTQLASAYYVNELTAELSSWILSKPLSIQGTFLRNAGAKKINGDKYDTGYQTGVIFGKASAKGTWEVAYFYKYLEADSTIADWADSDFGDGGTNRKGNIMWVAYSPLDWLTLQTKYFNTRVIDPKVTDKLGSVANIGNGDMNRVQVDAVVKF